MHQVQKALLARLTQGNGQKYSQLTRGYDFEDNVVFHLKKLETDGLIEKDSGLYKITAKGIKEIYDLGLPDLDYPGKKLFFCGFVVSDTMGNYLVKGHPTAKENFYNLPSGRPRFGEDMNLSLTRIFLESTGIKIDGHRFEFLSLHTKIVKDTEGEIMFDDAQAIFKVEVSSLEKEKMKLIKEIEWYSKEEIIKLPNCWPEIKMSILNNDIKPYSSYEVISDYKL